MKKLNKKLQSSLMAASLVSAITFSGNANAIEVAADHAGQVLLAPFYIVQGVGQKQGPVYIKVTNTSRNHAVKARIAFRSQKNSTEVLDFILYLSPGDVWRGRIENVGGQGYIKSEDDSVRNLPYGDSFASISPANVMMFDHNLKPDDNNEMGHFEIIAAYSVTGTVQTPHGPVTIHQGMSKFELAKIFDTDMGGVVDPNSLLALNAASCPNGATGSCMMRTDDPSTVQLRGEVSFNVLGERFSYVMTALDASYDKNGNFNKVISNPFYDVYVKTSVDLGSRFNLNGSDNILEIEKALAATYYSANYEYEAQGGDGNSIVFVTFPTKYKHHSYDVCGSGSTQEWTPPFNPTGSMSYVVNQYDNQENEVIGAKIAVSGGPNTAVAITPEVEWFLPEWSFGSGWYSLELKAAGGCGQHYKGVPAIVHTMTLRAGQSEFLPNSGL
jgi:hypothetical protein